MNRRSVLKSLIVAGAALPVLGSRRLAAATPSAEPSTKPGRALFSLGVATVSLKGLPLENALAAVKRVGLDSISLHRAHSPWENTPAGWRMIAEKIRAAGVAPRCCGVLNLKNDEVEMRRMFDYIRTLGVPLFSCSPEPAALPLLERLVREFDLRAAIHNHGPEDKTWPTAASVWKAIEALDPRIGLCLDIGHSYRAGEDPVGVIEHHADRLYDLHLKDSTAEVGHEDVPVEMGRGRLDLRAVFAALIRTGYRHHAWLEYEKDPNDPVPGLAESAGCVRGLLAGCSRA
jgi:inosose dehydratase